MSCGLRMVMTIKCIIRIRIDCLTMGGSDFIFYQWDVLGNTNLWRKTRVNVKLLVMEKM